MKPIRLPKLYSNDGTDHCKRCGTVSSRQHPLTWLNGEWRCSTECHRA